jgi:protein SCO1/2
MVHLVPGKDFQIVILSIDPNETPQLAAKKKAFYLKRYGHPETADGWHFLTGKKSGDRCSGAGNWFWLCARTRARMERLSQFAHASSIQIATRTR